MRRILGAWPRKTAFALLIAAWSGGAPSEVTLDGSLGGARGPLPGPDFEIGADFGRQVGSNLFHSFGVFNLNASERATFSGPNTINNVLGRVTGGSGSSINGTLRSTIPDANLFLLNPNGIVFGPSARLDVQGSFHASTGDFIRLEDGTQFDAAVPSANDALLTTARPQAFGFLGRQDPAPIEVKGSLLRVPEGKTLSLVGGDIAITGGSLFQAPSGRVNVASVASAGEVTLGDAKLGTRSFARLGKIDMTQGSTIDVSEADGSDTGGGRVLIRGGQFVMDNSQVLANTKKGGGKGIDIKLTDALVMKKGSSIEARTSGLGTGGDVAVKAGRMRLTEGAKITTNTNGPGKGGMIQVAAKDVLLEGVAVDEKGNVVKDKNGDTIRSGLFARARKCGDACGDAGKITVNAGRLRLTGGGEISASTTGGPGRAGDVDLPITEELAVQGGFTDANRAFTGSAISVSNSRRGDGGHLTINAGRLRVTEGAQIRLRTTGPGKGGNLTVEAKEIILEGTTTIANQRPIRSTIVATADGKEKGSGHGGNITITAGRLHLKDAAEISTATTGPGKGGNVTVKAKEIVLERAITIANQQFPIVSKIAATAEGSGDGGNITITAGRLHLKNSAEISTVTGGPGNSGNVTVRAEDIVLEKGKKRSGGEVSESALLARAFSSGDAGNVTVIADRLRLTDGGEISASTSGSGKGGDVTIKAEEIVLEGKLPSILSVRTQQLQGDAGKAGSITLMAGRLLLKEGALIRADTLGPGIGGRLTITVGDLQLSDRSEIRAITSGSGPGGRLFISATSIDLRDGSRITSQSTSDSPNAGQAGNITIRGKTSNSVGSLEVRDESEITTSTLGDGDAGRIDVKADTIKLVNRGRIASASGSDPDAGEFLVGTGDAGRVSIIDAQRLDITEGGSITTTTRGPGRGGAVDVEADEIVLEGRDSGLFAGAEGTAADSGGGGDLTVNAGSLMVKEEATISASTFGPGKGGKLFITAADLELRDGASITSESISERRNAGQSGEISILARDSLRLFNDSHITVETEEAEAGDITLDVGFLLHLREQSSITTSVAPGTDGKGTGNGGDITIDPVFTVLDGGSQIIANALEGRAGNIRIRTDFLFRSPDSEIQASNRFGVEGNIEIDSPDTDLNAGLVELPADFFDAATLLTQGCAAGADLSRLVVRKYEVLPDSPAALRVPPPGGLLNADTQGGGFALTWETLGPGFEHSSACDGEG